MIRLLTISSGIALSTLLARCLRPEGYGQYLYALSIAQFLAMPVLAGLPNLITRQVAIYRAHGDWSRLRGVLRWSSRFITLMALLVALVCLLWMWQARGVGGYAGVYLWLLPFIVTMTQMQLAASVINGFEKPVQATLPDGTIRPLLMLTLTAGTFLTGVLTPGSALACNVLANAAAATWAVWYFRRHIQPLYPLTQEQIVMETRAWLLSLIPLGMITISSLLSTQLDTVMLGYFATKRAVATYGIALQISGLVAQSRNLIYGVAGPRFARLWAQGDHVGLSEVINGTNKATVATVTAVWLGVLLVGEPVVRILVGREYAGAGTVASAASLTPLIASLFGPAPLVLIMTGHEKIYLRNSVIMAIVNAGLNCILIPRYGAMGSVVATIFAEIAFQTSANIALRRLCHMRTDIVFTLSSWYSKRALLRMSKSHIGKDF